MIPPAHVGLDLDPITSTLHASGAWQYDYAPALETLIATIPQNTIRRLDLSAVTAADSVGGKLLAQLIVTLQQHSPTLTIIQPPDAIAGLIKIIIAHPVEIPQPRRYPISPINAITKLGERSQVAYQQASMAFTLMITVFSRLAVMIVNPRRLRLTALIHHCDQAGIGAMPVIAVMSFLIGLTLTQQGAVVLQQFGAQSFIVDLIAVSMLREIGVLLTCIMVAGRTGSAYAAAIAAMKDREELDAMRIIGIDITETLVIPRLLALMIMLPLLTFLANLAGLFGGAVAAWLVLDLSFGRYLGLVLAYDDLITPLMIGLSKTPIMAFAIAFIGCFEGLRAGSGTEQIGFHTTRAVVETIFTIIVIDALFAIFYTSIGL